MAYIDLKVATNAIGNIDTSKVYDDKDDIVEQAISILDHLPSADVDEVVRCKDCIHYKTSPLFPEKQGKYCYKVLKNNGIAVGHGFNENDYCSYGERLEADGDKSG